MPNETALRDLLRNAISRSRKKRYHGYETEINELPKLEQQTVSFINSKSDPFIYYDEGKKSFLDGNDPKWKEAVVSKFDWIKLIEDTKGNGECTPKFYAELSDRQAIEVLMVNQVKQEFDLLNVQRNLRNEPPIIDKLKKTTKSTDYESLSWRELYHKLCFEQMLDLFQHNQDFKLFYKFI